MSTKSYAVYLLFLLILVELCLCVSPRLSKDDTVSEYSTRGNKSQTKKRHLVQKRYKKRSNSNSKKSPVGGTGRKASHHKRVEKQISSLHRKIAHSKHGNKNVAKSQITNAKRASMSRAWSKSVDSKQDRATKRHQKSASRAKTVSKKEHSKNTRSEVVQIEKRITKQGKTQKRPQLELTKEVMEPKDSTSEYSQTKSDAIHDIINCAREAKAFAKNGIALATGSLSSIFDVIRALRNMISDCKAVQYLKGGDTCKSAVYHLKDLAKIFAKESISYFKNGTLEDKFDSLKRDVKHVAESCVDVERLL